MAHFGKDIDNITSTSSIQIKGTETNDAVTIYIIQVNVGPYSWTVKHRYSDFHDLHEKLCSGSRLDKNLLPPKKLFGNQSETFIRKRQHDLEVYLQTVLHFVSHKMPSCFASFLEFENYEIHGITQRMAEELYNKGFVINKGDSLLENREPYCTTPLHLYSLTERLKLPEPTCESGDVKRDLGHILDFITRLKCLQVVGEKKVGTSNIDMNSLQFDLSLFKSLQFLKLSLCNIGLVGGLEIVKQTLRRLTVRESIESIREVLLQDLPHWRADDGTLLVTHWGGVTHVDFSHNSITQIDDSMQLLPRVVHLEMSHNEIGCIENLHWLSHLVHLDVSYNNIEHLDALHSRLGNLKTLNLAGNRLVSLNGLSKMFSLDHLDLSYNRVQSVDEIKPIGNLPCLEVLLLLGNPVTLTLDYRTKTLTLFGERVKEIELDKLSANQKELDTVAVMQAIQKSKDKARDIRLKKESSSASLFESQSPMATSLGNHLSNSSLAHLAGNMSLPQHPSNSSLTLMDVNNLGSQLASRGLDPGDLNSAPSDRKHGNSETGNEVRQTTPLLQKYNLFSRHSQPALRGAKHVSGGTESQSSSTQEEHESSYQGLHRRSSSSSDHTSSSNGYPPSQQSCIDISSLPTHHNHSFYAAIHERLFGISDSDDCSVVEVIKYILWCQCIQYNNTDSVLPCCVVLTERRIFVLQLKNAESLIQEVPALETFYILPLCNIQQVMVGLCYSFVRVEESFVGSSGTFVFIVWDSDKGKEFYEELKMCTESPLNGSGELDVIDGYQDCDISKQLFEVEDAAGECTGRIAYASYVTVTDTGCHGYLVMSENHVYIFKTCIYFSPKPTFDASALSQAKSKFEIFEKFSVGAEISEIVMRKKHELRREVHELPPLSPLSGIQYLEHELSMVFHELLGFHRFHYTFLSSRARDTFLDGLTKLRSEHAHQMLPSPREDPEGGNESSESSGDALDGKRDRSGSQDTNGDDDDGNAGNSAMTYESGVTHDFLKSELNLRKFRSKTEVVILKDALTDELQDMPSYAVYYLSPELTAHLEKCVRNCNLFQPLTPKMQSLTEMSGERLAQFFHMNIVPVGEECNEELHHIIWTNAISFTNPLEEILTCVMMSTKAVYLLSDQHVAFQRHSGRPSWMTHARHVSDTVNGLQSKMADRHHSSGILHSSKTDSTMIKSYCNFNFSDIKQIHVGLFDQCLRLTGERREKVITLVTRDSEATSLFLKQLSAMLSLYIASPSLESSLSDFKQDFYKSSDRRTKTTVEGIEYTHPSKVKFCYPGEESIEDLLFLINEHLRTASVQLVGRENILQYIVGYKTHSSLEEFEPLALEPISFILTNACLCFVTEDLVSYPLPDFVRGLPSIPRHHVNDVKKIEYLKCIKQRRKEPRDITLMFSDVKEDIVLVPDHYSLEDYERDSPREIPVRMFVQSVRELNKFLMLVTCHWKDTHPMGDEFKVVQI
ncbi:nischarin-like isoform X1 [Dreissena polymorpha]|uniref:nischarin-like isoform X1 n=1 Tax=Dreissena polymorpha TaxID=45954 RepID=UPI0022649903|nr:nischarin-like isoform X1 [Dreissena polymorpha]